jgi:spore coat protein U-like protein
MLATGAKGERIGNMPRKMITIAALAVAVGALSSASTRVAQADQKSFQVNATVSSSTTISSIPNVNIGAWTAATSQTFDVTVATNDSGGYTVAFAGLTPNAFTLVGTKGGKSTYTVTGPPNDTTYSPGIAGKTPLTTSPSTFTIHLTAPTDLAPDTYSDTLTVTVLSATASQ